MGWGSLTFSLVLIFLAMAVMLLVKSDKLRKESGLPGGKVIYTDDETWYPNNKPLHSPTIRLVGKPDYLVRQRSGEIIPVEVKSSVAPGSPWEGHILQLAAYCYLVGETYGVRPSYGILQYKDRAFAVDYTLELEDTLLEMLNEMRHDAQSRELNRNHNDAHRCAACGFAEKCTQQLSLIE
jgi:CRISPR-associated exonuclease Cas4